MFVLTLFSSVSSEFIKKRVLTVKPLKVEILGKDQILSAGKTYDVKCQSTGSRPPAVLTWWKSSKQLKGQKKNVSDAKIPFSFALRLREAKTCRARTKGTAASRLIASSLLNRCFEIREAFSRLHKSTPLYYID